MRKIMFLSFAMFSITLLQGQSIEKEVEAAQKLLKEKSYNASILQLKQAIAIVEKEQLKVMKSDIFPEKVQEFKKVNTYEGLGIQGSYISGKRIELNQVYAKPNQYQEANNEGSMENSNTILSIHITNSPDNIYEIVNAHAGNISENVVDQSLQPVLYKGYRAVQSFDEGMDRARLAIMVGAAIVEINVGNVEGEKQLFDIANSIDIDKVIQYFGK